MHLLRKICVFIWFSFLYRTVHCDLKSGTSTNALARGKVSYSDTSFQELTEKQRSQLYDELKDLSPERRRKLFDELQKQRRDYERSRNKWARLRDTLQEPDELSPVSQVEVDIVSKKIRTGSVPVVRDKRTLKFLIESLAEILGLRWTLLKYSLVVPLINNVVAPPASSAAPAPPAPPAKGAPPAARPAAPAPPGRLPPPRPKQPPSPRQPPPKTAPPPPPPPPPAKPGAAPASPSAPPTIPPNQIDPNTIRYPFRPAPTIPILTFAPLPPGVTVPYPPLFQWPTLIPAPPMPASPAPGAPAPKGPPPQPPCAAPPPAPPPKAGPPPPSRLPLPKPRPPVPPPPKPVPQAPKGPSKTPLKLEYDHPVRIEIFNNVKPYLPVSGSVYSGNPTLASHEENPTEHYENPTQAVIQAINDQYNTEPYQENRDYDYGFYTPSHVNIEGNVETTPQQVVDYYENHQNNDGTTALYNAYYDDNQYNNEREETTTTRYNEGFVSNVYHDYDRIETTTTRYNEEFGNSAYNDYPEQVEENRAHVNIKVTSSPKGGDARRIRKRIRKPKKSVFYKADESKVKPRWGVSSTASSEKKVELVTSRSTPISVFSTPSARTPNRVAATIRRPSTTTTEIPPNHSKNYKRVVTRTRNHFENIIPTSNEKLSYQTSKSLSGKSYTTISRMPDPRKPANEFRIIVPSRRRRDLFFDDAFKNFNSSFKFLTEKYESIEDVPTSSQSQFLDLHGNGQLSPNEEYRKKLEKDVEKYVEQYVEKQISNGEINPNKPKTTIIELQTKTGPPIKTVTTTLSKVIDGDKDLLESILEYSKDINPVSNVAELASELSGVDPTEASEVSKAFINDHFKDAFKWDFK